MIQSVSYFTCLQGQPTARGGLSKTSYHMILHQLVKHNNTYWWIALYTAKSIFFVSLFLELEKISLTKKGKTKETTKYRVTLLELISEMNTRHWWHWLNLMQFSIKSHQSMNHNTLNSVEALESCKRPLSQLCGSALELKWSKSIHHGGRAECVVSCLLCPVKQSEIAMYVVGMVNGCLSSFQNVSRICSLFLLLFILLTITTLLWTPLWAILTV